MYRIIKPNANPPRYFHYIPMAEDEYIFIWELNSMEATLFESKTEALEKIWLCGLYYDLRTGRGNKMKTYQRRKGVIAWQYDTEENFWKWIEEAKFTLGFDTEEQSLGLKVNIFSDFGLEKSFFIHKGNWIVFELNNFTVYDNKTFKKLFKEIRQYDV